uniref:Thioredoxin domain-containing protein n=1 Tax=Heterorhabditis bacteriophora TaxID=37862 RepID=A0A1I7XTH4_HETBA
MKDYEDLSQVDLIWNVKDVQQKQKCVFSLCPVVAHSNVQSMGNSSYQTLTEKRIFMKSGIRNKLTLTAYLVLWESGLSESEDSIAWIFPCAFPTVDEIIEVSFTHGINRNIYFYQCLNFQELATPQTDSNSVIDDRNKTAFDAIIKDNPDCLIIIDFYATWCGPCKIMGPKFSKMSNEFPNVVFIKVDVDESEDIVSRFAINVMPTFIFMRNGAQIVGLFS